MRRSLISIVVALVLVVTAGVSISPAAGGCSLYRSWDTGNTLTASDLTQSLVTVGQTNMILSCIDDYSANASQMQSTVDPYPGSAVSLSTSLQGEIERIRHVIKALTGWTQWYTHTETPTFSGTAPVGAKYVVQTANGTLTAEHDLGSLTTGLLLNTVAASEGTLSAYGGTSCTNQFPRSLDASGAATCASVANDDLAGSIAASKLVGTDIATVGTITSGIWTGTAVGTQYGGTGQNFSATAQGNILYFSAAGTMAVLAPGTSGYFLKTQGAGANPTWDAASSLESGTWSDVSGSRALDTIYQNTGGKKRRVVTSVRVDANEQAQMLVGSASPPTLVANTVYNATGAGSSKDMPVYVEVPNNWYYKLASTVGTPSLPHAWLELDE